MDLVEIREICIDIDKHLASFCSHLTSNQVPEHEFADELDEFLEFYNRQKDYYVHLTSTGRYRHDILVRFDDAFLSSYFILKKDSRRWSYDYEFITITNLNGEIIQEW